MFGRAFLGRAVGGLGAAGQPEGRDDRERDDDEDGAERDQEDPGEEDVQDHARQVDQVIDVSEMAALGLEGRDAIEVFGAFEVLDAVDLADQPLKLPVELVVRALRNGQPEQLPEAVHVPDAAKNGAQKDGRNPEGALITAHAGVDEQLDRHRLQWHRQPCPDAEEGRDDHAAPVGREGSAQDHAGSAQRLTHRPSRSVALGG